ncbi:MAG: 2-amino-4-hydroxy-6-hydroxymethyldihydropteridine diphosphokinase, partial [Thermoguttaceae bacterium]|nr:2-amino-4-hydroxy-6-hydroxymethyldihydropteridine diphosphokinase [Thermoguttaceae bacterium]
MTRPATKVFVETAPTPILIAFGSNLGDSSANIQEAARLLAAAPGVSRVRLSSIIRTFPAGGPKGQPIFANAVATASTVLEPLELLKVLQSVEVALRRERRERWGPRTLDADLILFGAEILDFPELKVPHPRAVWRDFVLRPACEIASEWRFPTTGLSIREQRAALIMNFE